MKKALVIGASGQAGSYLCELLLKKGYDVTGTYYLNGETNIPDTGYINCLPLDIRVDYQLERVLNSSEADEVYNMASEMFAPDSWECPSAYLKVNTLPVLNILKYIATHCPKTKFFQAGSAEMFYLNGTAQHEKTPILPRNPYGISKQAAYEAVRTYRTQKDVFSCTGIFFNMESPRRSTRFFASKVANEVAAIKAGKQKKLKLGALWAQRDWGLAEEYVEAAWMMLQSKFAHDYVIGTGECHSCLSFVQYACEVADIDFEECVEWNKDAPKDYDIIKANPIQIQKELGWKAKSAFHEVVRTLVHSALSVYTNTKVAV